VGHGTAILVELPDGRTLLYDAGRLGSPLSGARPIASVLWSRGVTHLDAVVISHADLDHYNALPELLERFSVGKVYVSTVMWNGGAPGPKVLRDAIDRRDLPVEALRAGDLLGRELTGGTRIEVLHPPRGGVFGSDNANSIVLLIQHAGHRALLTGDLEARGLADLLAEPAVDVDLLMAPHHGSVRSNPQGLAEWCRPEHVVISGARDFELGRDDEMVARSFYAAGATVYHTAQHGSIRFEFNRDHISAEPYRVPPDPSDDSVYALATKAK
jgi:competence protein ComEC